MAKFPGPTFPALPAMAPPTAGSVSHNPCFPIDWVPPYIPPPPPPPSREPDNGPVPGNISPPTGVPATPVPKGVPAFPVPQGQPGTQPDSSVPRSRNPRRSRFVGGPNRSARGDKAAPVLVTHLPAGKAAEDVDDFTAVAWTFRDTFDESYPWPAALNRRNYPTPGMFFDANNPEGAFVFRSFDELVKATLGSALAMAGQDSNLATGNSETSRRLRKQVSEAILCSKFNDALYGTPTASRVGPHGRGIDWSPRHVDVFGYLSEGIAPPRAIDAEGKRRPEHIEANFAPLVWIPAPNLAALQGADPQFTEEGMTWSDGESTQEPSPVVRRIGVNMEGVRLPGGLGCPATLRMDQPRRRGSGDATAYWRRSRFA